jgi:hypothetical protein
MDFIYFPPPHNQWTTSDLVLSVVKYYGLHTKVRAVTTDSGSEMPPAMKHLRLTLKEDYDLDLKEYWHISCV